MGFRLNAIFITNQEGISNEELLQKVGLKNLKKCNPSDFYGTNKKWDSIFIGSKGNCKIICNGELASSAFQEKNPFINFKKSEIASIIWNETADLFGFSLIKEGKIIRKAMMVNDRELDDSFGNPIEEELELKDEKLISQEDKKEIIEYDGEEVYKEILRAARIQEAAHNLVKRYLGKGFLEIKESIELHEYK